MDSNYCQTAMNGNAVTTKTAPNDGTQTTKTPITVVTAISSPVLTGTKKGNGSGSGLNTLDKIAHGCGLGPGSPATIIANFNVWGLLGHQHKVNGKHMFDTPSSGKFQMEEVKTVGS
jgi:hypothetical protein